MNNVDRVGRTELHYAALDNDVDRVRQLLAAEADPNAQDVRGFTPLELAAQQYSLGAAAVLLEGGAAVDLANSSGNTPLQTATFNSRGRGDMIALLRKYGADPFRRNNAGKTPIDLAKLIANFDVAQFYDDLEA